MAKGCSHSGCDRPHQGHGLCNLHYQRALRARRKEQREQAGTARKYGRSPCTVDGCTNQVNGRGLCNKHYQRARVQSRLSDLPLCTREGCRRRSHIGGECNLHYQASLRKRRGIAERLGTPVGTRCILPTGYVEVCARGNPLVKSENGRILEHRLVMAQHIGRPLDASETVHHINGDRSDNRLANLELWATGQPRGQRVTDIIAWCRDFLAKYEHIEKLT
jgi:hypothetical protein